MKLNKVERRRLIKISFAAMAVFVMAFSIIGSREPASLEKGNGASPGSVAMPTTVTGLQCLLMDKFYAWDNNIHPGTILNNTSRTVLLKEFLKSDNYAASIMDKMAMIQEEGFSPKAPPNSTFEEYVIQHGNPTVDSIRQYHSNGVTFTLTDVTYSLMLGNKEYRVEAALTKFTNGTEYVDPLDNVQIDYLTFWFFGTVTYGEVDVIYQDYFYNTIGYTYPYAVNEASSWKAAIDAAATTLGGAGLADALFPLLLGSIGLVAWVFTALWDAADLATLALDVNAAYSADQGVGFIPTYIQNDYIYPGYTYIQTVLSGWGIHVFTGFDYGWQNALIPEAFSAVDSPGISNAAHTFLNNYGNNWIWVGAY